MLLAEAWLQSPDEQSLREYGADADEREEEGVGRSIPPEARVGKEREVRQESGEGEVQQKDRKQKPPDAPDPQHPAQLRQGVEAAQRRRHSQFGGQRLRQDEEAKCGVGQGQRGGSEGRGV